MANFIIPYHLHNSRLDKAISYLVPEYSRSYIQKIINDANVKVNNVIINYCAFKVKDGDVVDIVLKVQTSSNMQATYIPLDIIYEDDYLIVLNKQAGLTVHPGAGNHHDTLANALLYHFKSLSNIGGVDRPGILHRLDKDTSGLMIVAKDNNTHAMLAAELADRTLVRKYKALIWGTMMPINGTITSNIIRDKVNRKKMTTSKSCGKYAVSHYKTEKIFQNGLMSLIECKLETGRTHQIRVHFSSAGHGIVGDQVYGNNSRKVNSCAYPIKQLLVNFKRQALHSSYIRFVHPQTNHLLEFTIELPYDMEGLINNIEVYSSLNFCIKDTA